ncbi:ATP-binding protein [Mycolicibacterium gadium]|uniref:ATP-binding protein n=1 Tax=Mycolicibacterium gadium TaxID=1794 RepID=A0ABT6GU52_MYCGU|nr:ATP-binding protein [Mycolicibacterium gadium]MDG5485182.1 ATP-binding protein [Mycolicibacterium gadium]
MSEHAMEALTGPDTLAEIQRTLDLAWAEEDVSDHTKMCIELAVSEIGTNIIAYSGDGRPVRLRMVVDVRPESVAVSFTDDGHPAEVDLTRVKMADEAAESGRGLALAHRVLDELSYWRDQKGNHWTLTRRRSE